ncbi:MAG TPA: hypothetical protein DCR43_07765 [Bacteroidales bacterium]|nr:hypothetical protein [Bacteroidales bacterium]
MFKRYQLILYTLTIAGLLSGCLSRQANNARPLVAVSILPLQYLVDNISGGTVESMVMLPPGTNHEAYDPAPKQMAQLAGAKLYLTTGNTAFDETWLPNLAENNPQMTVRILTDGIELIAGSCNHEEHYGGDHHEGIDPHYRLAPRSFKLMASGIFRELSRMMPENKALFQQKYDSIASVIDGIDSLASKELVGLSNRHFMVFHPALTYFARDYGLEQVAIEADGKAPGVSGLRSFIDIAREGNIKVIFIQKEYDSTNAAAIAREIGGTTRSFDHMAYDWPANMTRIIQSMKESLNQ